MSCSGCGVKFAPREQYVRISGDPYHERCIRCARCGKKVPKNRVVLAESANGVKELCHEECLAGKCAICKSLVHVGEAAFSLDKTRRVHQMCLTCTVCSKPIGNDSNCRVFADIRAIHEKCFCCSSCEGPLNEMKLHQHPYWPSCFYCEKCASSGKSSSCFSCERKFKAEKTIEYPGGLRLCLECHSLGVVSSDADSINAILAVLSFFQSSLKLEFTKSMLKLQTRDVAAETAAVIPKPKKVAPLLCAPAVRARRQSLTGGPIIIPSPPPPSRVRRNSAVEDVSPTFEEVIKSIPIELVEFKALNEAPKSTIESMPPSSKRRPSVVPTQVEDPGEIDLRDRKPKRLATRSFYRGEDEADDGLARQVTLTESLMPRAEEEKASTDHTHFYGRTDCASVRVVEVMYEKNKEGVKVESDRRIEIVRQVRRIVLLRGLPDAVHSANLAHELMHAWLFLEGYTNLPLDVEEGICNYVSAKYLESRVADESGLKSDLLKLRLWKMDRSKDPIYGDGYRNIRRTIEVKNKKSLQKYLFKLKGSGSKPSRERRRSKLGVPE